MAAEQTRDHPYGTLRPLYFKSSPQGSRRRCGLSSAAHTFQKEFAHMRTSIPKFPPFRAASLFAKSEGRKLALHFPCGRKPDPGQACRMASDTIAAGKRTSAKEWSNSGQVNLLMRVQLAYIFSAERVRIPRDDILWRIQANARHRGRTRRRDTGSPSRTSRAGPSGDQVRTADRCLAYVPSAGLSPADRRNLDSRPECARPSARRRSCRPCPRSGGR